MVKRLILLHEIAFEKKNIYGDTALHLALKLRNERICEILLQADTGNKFYVKNNDKLTPKRLAQRLNLMEMYKFNTPTSPSTLLKYG